MKTFWLTVIWVAGCAAGLALGQSVEYADEEIEFAPAPDRPLEVQIRVDAGEVLIEPSATAGKGAVSLEYLTDKFKSRVEFDEERNRLRVDVRGRGWNKWSDAGDHPAVLMVTLPTDTDIRLDTRLKAGEMTQNLGGLRITGYHLSNWAGEIQVRFDQPNPVVMDFFDADVKIGEAHFARLGNARFQKADINGGIGELEVDFSGDLISRSQARVDLDIGEARIVLPSATGTRLQIGGAFSFLSAKEIDSDFQKRNRYYYSSDYDSAETKFAVRVTPGLGELRIDRE